jgi:hypothetical protein
MKHFFPLENHELFHAKYAMISSIKNRGSRTYGTWHGSPHTQFDMVFSNLQPEKSSILDITYLLLLKGHRSLAYWTKQNYFCQRDMKGSVTGYKVLFFFFKNHKSLLCRTKSTSFHMRAMEVSNTGHESISFYLRATEVSPSGSDQSFSVSAPSSTWCLNSSRDKFNKALQPYKTFFRNLRKLRKTLRQWRRKKFYIIDPVLWDPSRLSLLSRGQRHQRLLDVVLRPPPKFHHLHLPQAKSAEPSVA